MKNHRDVASLRSRLREAEMMDWIREIVSLGIRRPGYPAGLETESWLAAKFAAFGLQDVRLEPVPVNCWESSRTELTFSGDGTSIPCAAVPYTAWTAPDGATAPCVHVGEGHSGDFDSVDAQGKIVVADLRFAELSAAVLRTGSHFVHDPGDTIPDGPLHAANWLFENFAAYHEARRRGAVAFIGWLRDSPIDGCDHWVPYDGFLKKLPAAWVGREHGNALLERAHREEEAVFTSIGKCREVDSHNVVGVVPGASDESIIVTCHHDAPFASAVEDASGLAALLALAQSFAGTGAGDRLQRNLVFVASSGHFHGGIGNRVFVQRHREGLLRKTVAALGVEHIGHEVEGDGHGGYRLTGLPEVRALFVDDSPRLVGLVRDAVERHDIERSMLVRAYLFGPEPPCDSAPFFTAGIPSVCHISGPLYLFDPHDTVDKVRSKDLPRVAALFADLIHEIDTVPGPELEEGLTRRRGDPPAPPPPWFLPPQD